MKSKNLIFTTLLRCIIFVFSFLSLSNLAFTQVSCGGQTVTECLKYPSQTYQCIDADASSQVLYGTKLLSPSLALVTPQYLLVRGKLTFSDDYSFAAGSDIVFLDNNSGFIVSNNKKLTLTASTLHGCTKLWAGVEVLPTATIISKDCEFEDAKAAIILRNLSVVEITGNTFKKNVYSILGMSSNPAIYISLFLRNRSGISGNTFWGNHQLLESFSPSSIDPGLSSGNVGTGTTNYPYSGIWIDRVTALTIGKLSNNSGASLNTFLNFGKNKELAIETRGIGAIRSNVNILNCVFSNFGTFDAMNTANNIEAQAVLALNTDNVVTQTTFTGINKTASISPSTTFSNCWEDIKTRGTNLTVTDMTSYKAGNSISAGMFAFVQNPISVKIENNTIDYFRSKGININFVKPISININNNKIFDNNELFDVSTRNGILIDNQGNASFSLNGSAIFNNEILSRSQLFEGSFLGIALRRSSYLNIYQNEIRESLTSSNLSVFTGIRIQDYPCNGLRLYSNIIKGSKIDYNGLSSGIYIIESVNCILNCNETDKTNTGITFLNGCDPVDLSKNKFNFHDNGLALGSPLLGLSGMIGLQSAKENRWFGTSSSIEAFALDQASALSSIFEINSSDLNSDYWPSPRKIGAIDDNFTWFKQLQGQEPSNDFSCLTIKTFGEKNISDSDIRLRNNTYQPPLNYPALIWEAKWQFADRLNRNPDLVSLSNLNNTYYQNTYGQNYSQLNRIYQGYQNRFTPNGSTFASVENFILQLNNTIEQRFALDVQLSENSEDNTNLYTLMLSTDATIRSTASTLSTSTNNLLILVNQNINNLLSDIDNVTCTEPYETDMKIVLRTMLLSHATGGLLTEVQSSQIASIANKCRYSGGYAVVLARGFFESKDIYPQDKNCTSNEREDIQALLLSELVTLYPNPVNDAVNLKIGQPFEVGTVRLFNTQGSLIRTIDLLGQNTLINLDGLPNGMYFIDLRLDNAYSVHKQFFKSH